MKGGCHKCVPTFHGQSRRRQGGTQGTPSTRLTESKNIRTPSNGPYETMNQVIGLCKHFTFSLNEEEYDLI